MSNRIRGSRALRSASAAASGHAIKVGTERTPLKSGGQKRKAEEVFEDDSAAFEPSASIGVTGSKYFSKRTTRSGSIASESPSKLKGKAKEEDVDVDKPAEKAPRKKLPKPIQMALAVPHPAPKHWEEQYALIKETRKGIIAPVDTMGCHTPMLGPDLDLKAQRFGVLISLMLSSQTKDEVTSAAIANLRIALGGSLTLEGMLAAENSVIEGAINKVGFWRRKTQYIKQAAQILKDKFSSDIPKTVDDLCSLPGVGPKMAFLAMQVAWDENVGIGVDVHVHRITNRLRWHKPSTTTPEQTRLNLQSWLPNELHAEINPLLVGFGQTVCLPVGPRCDACSLSAKGLCPSARIVKPGRSPAKGRGGPKIEIEVEAVRELVVTMEESVKDDCVKSEAAEGLSADIVLNTVEYALTQ